MECLQDDGGREINHHGSKITVNEKGNETLFQKSDKMIREGPPRRYTMPSFSIDYLKLSRFAAKTGIPIVIITFSVLYWTYGLYFYFYPAL